MFDAVVSGSRDVNAGALIIRIKLWGPFYCHYNKRPPPKKKYIKAPILTVFCFVLQPLLAVETRTFEMKACS